MFVVCVHLSERTLVFNRYAQLGRVVGADGQPITVGMRIKKSDKIGEVGSSKILHF